MIHQEPVWAIIRKSPGGNVNYLTDNLAWSKVKAAAFTGSKKLMEHLVKTSRFKGIRVVDLTKGEDMQ